jgi:hypothetical protein
MRMNITSAASSSEFFLQQLSTSAFYSHFLTPSAYRLDDFSILSFNAGLDVESAKGFTFAVKFWFELKARAETIN